MELQETPEAQVNEIIEIPTTIRNLEPKPHLFMTFQEFLALPRTPMKDSKVIINLSGTRYPVVTKVARDLLDWYCARDPKDCNDDWNIQWYDTYITNETLRNMLPFQKINHIPGSFELGRKNLLCKNLSKMRKYLPNDYNYFPKTWMIPHQWEELKTYYMLMEEGDKKNKQMYIVKPEAACQGKGIFLTKRADTFGPNDHCIVQEYIADPYLIDDLKFDLRIYALVKSISPLKIFIYREGMARFATVKYEKPKKKNMKNMCMHLTNYAINKRNPDFQQNEGTDDSKGHKRSFSSILQHIQDHGGDSAELFREICNVIAKTIISVQPHLASIYKSCQHRPENSEMCFEVFGFDIMIGSDLKPWVLEVNHTPSFSTDSKFDYQLKKNLILDTLNMMNVTHDDKKKYYEAKNNQNKLNGPTKMSQSEYEKLCQDTRHWENKYGGAYLQIYPPNKDNRHLYNIFESANRIYNTDSNRKNRADDCNVKDNLIINSILNTSNMLNSNYSNQMSPNPHSVHNKESNLVAMATSTSTSPLKRQNRITQRRASENSEVFNTETVSSASGVDRTWRTTKHVKNLRPNERLQPISGETRTESKLDSSLDANLATVLTPLPQKAIVRLNKQNIEIPPTERSYRQRKRIDHKHSVPAHPNSESVTADDKLSSPDLSRYKKKVRSQPGSPIIVMNGYGLDASGVPSPLKIYNVHNIQFPSQHTRANIRLMPILPKTVQTQSEKKAYIKKSKKKSMNNIKFSLVSGFLDPIDTSPGTQEDDTNTQGDYNKNDTTAGSPRRNKVGEQRFVIIDQLKEGLEKIVEKRIHGMQTMEDEKYSTKRSNPIRPYNFKVTLPADFQKLEINKKNQTKRALNE